MKLIAVSTMFVLALAGCAQSRWDKPNAPADVAAADMAECRRAAYQEAFRRGPGVYAGSSFGSPAPLYHDDIYWRGGYAQSDGNYRFMLQNRFADACMRQKGYARVPIDPS